MNESHAVESSLTPSEAVVLEISNRTGTEPTALPILNESIDPEALDELVLHCPSCSVSFTYAGFRITVYDQDHIEIGG